MRDTSTLFSMGAAEPNKRFVRPGEGTSGADAAIWLWRRCRMATPHRLRDWSGIEQAAAD